MTGEGLGGPSIDAAPQVLMKILHVHNNHRFGGGSDLVAGQTVRLLREAGHEVVEFTRNSRDLAVRGLRGKAIAFASGIYNPRTTRAFERALKEHRPDVVHAHELYPLITPWIYPLCRKHGIASVMTCHDYRLTCPVFNHYRKGQVCTECIERNAWMCVRNNCRGNVPESAAYTLQHVTGRLFRLFQYVDFFITPSIFTRDWLIRHAGIESDRIRAVGNPIFVDAGSVKPYRPHERTYVAYAGRFFPEKGIDVLLRAAAMAGVTVRLAGEPRGFERETYGARAEFLGPLKPEDMNAFYDGARGLAVPSRWFETFGLVAVEAMARGVPVICSNIGALRELVDPGVHGRLCEPGHVEQWAAALKHLWNDPEACTRMSAACLRRAADYSPHRYLDNVLEAYTMARK